MVIKNKTIIRELEKCSRILIFDTRSTRRIVWNVHYPPSSDRWRIIVSFPALSRNKDEGFIWPPQRGASGCIIHWKHPSKRGGIHQDGTIQLKRWVVRGIETPRPIPSIHLIGNVEWGRLESWLDTLHRRIFVYFCCQNKKNCCKLSHSIAQLRKLGNQAVAKNVITSDLQRPLAAELSIIQLADSLTMSNHHAFCRSSNIENHNW